MKLPPGDLKPFLMDVERLNMRHYAIAFRHGRLWIYATSGRHGVRLEIQTSEEELQKLEGELRARKIPETWSIVLQPNVYQALRKSFFRIEIDSEKAYAHVFDGARYEAQLQDARLPELLEALIEMESTRTSLGTLTFDPQRFLELRKAVQPETELANFETPVECTRPFILRNGGNIGLVMPATDSEMPGVAILIAAAQKAMNKLPSELNPHDLARLILKTFGQTLEIAEAERIGQQS